MPTLLRPPPILAFDRVSSEQLWADEETEEITAHAPLWMTVQCAHDGFHRVEVYLARHFHYGNSALWLLVYAGDLRELSADAVPLRVAGPMIGEQLASAGWFGFEFDPIWSAERTFTLCCSAPGAATQDAVTLRAMRMDAEGSTDALKPVYRTVSLIPGAESLWENFRGFRRGLLDPSDVTSHDPIMARLEMSRACDLGCVMCVRGLQPFRKERDGAPFMTFDTFQRVEEIVPHLLWVSAFGLGEPFLNPDVIRILRHIRDLNPFTRTFISSNGNRLQPAHIERVFAEELISDFQISLDGADRKTFEAIRPRASYERVMRSLDGLVRARDLQRDVRTRAKVEMLVMRSNASLVYKTIKQMFDLGIDQVLLASPEGSHCAGLRLVDSDWEDVVGQLIRAHDETRGRGFIIDGPFLNELDRWHRSSGRTGTLPEWGIGPCATRVDIGPQRPIDCSIPWESVTVRADGRFGLCCNSSRDMGAQMRDATLRPWQQGSAYRAVRQEMIERRHRADCATCLAGGRMAPDIITPETYTTACVSVDDVTARFTRMLNRPRPQTAAHVRTVVEVSGPVARARVVIGGAGDHRSCKLEGAGDRERFSRGDIISIRVRDRVRAHAVVAADDGRWSAWIHGPDVPPASADLVLIRGRKRSGFTHLERMPVVLGENPLLTATSFVPAKQALCSGLVGVIDSVECHDGIISVRGWVRDRHAASALPTVLVTIEGTPAAAVRPWMRRMDVARVEGVTPDVCGFHIDWPLTLARVEGPRQVALIAVSYDGTRYNELPWPSRRRVLATVENATGKLGSALVIEQARAWLVGWTQKASAMPSTLLRRWSARFRFTRYRPVGYAFVGSDSCDGRCFVHGWACTAPESARRLNVRVYRGDGSVFRTATGIWRGISVDDDGAYAGFFLPLPPGDCSEVPRVEVMDERGRSWPLPFAAARAEL